MDHLIQRFYSAFNDHNGETMAACYATDARFCDPVFPDLRGAEPGAMWKMLTGRAGDLRIELAEHEASGDSGSAGRSAPAFGQPRHPSRALATPGHSCN